MSLSTLLTEPVTILRYQEGTVDDYGNPTSTWIDVGVVNGRMEQRSGEERTIDGNVLTSDWVLYLPASTEVHGRDRVSDRFGRTFEVTGPSNIRSTPTRDVYVEVSLRHVENA